MNNYQNNIEFLLNTFKQNLDKTALIWKNQRISYGVLHDRILFWNDNLVNNINGKVVGIEGDFSPETISILIALINLKCIIVPFDISNTTKNQEKIKIANLQSLIRVNDDENVEIQKFNDVTIDNKLYKELEEKNSPGLVLFTSGSSGKPKGACHDFSKLLEKFKVQRKALVTINFLLFDHWGGLNTLFHILSNSGTVIILENRKPDYVCELIERYSAELLPTSPTFLNLLLLSRAYERFSLKSLKIISYGAEPMPESLLKNLNKIFPEIVFQQTYGLIELGVMRSKSEGNGSLWVKIGGEGYEVRVVDNMLQIKSESAMLGYLNAPSPFTDDGWFMTGDAVEVKGDLFRILGRKSELINVGGEKVYPQEVESVILEIPEIEDVLVYGEDNNLTGKIVCAKVKYIGDKKTIEIINEIKFNCRKRLESYKVPVKVQIVNESFRSERFKKARISE